MSHFYSQSGEPKYYVEKKSGGGLRPSTIADCRKNGWLPGCTEILKVLDKPALTKWLIEQAVDAVLTAPRRPGESLDDFKLRVLVTEAQQDEESRKAKDRGTEIHDGLEAYLGGKPVAPELLPWIEPAAKAVLAMGKPLHLERVLVGPGYAGRCDLILDTPEGIEVLDWKTTKRLPKGEAWNEHKLQGAAYAYAYEHMGLGEARLTSNLYISTVECGQFVYCPHGVNWMDTYLNGFEHLVALWQYLNSYRPTEPEVKVHTAAGILHVPANLVGEIEPPLP